MKLRLMLRITAHNRWYELAEYFDRLSALCALERARRRHGPHMVTLFPWGKTG